MSYLAFGGLYWRYELIILKMLKKWVVVVLTIGYIIVSIAYRPYLYSGYMISMDQIHVVGVIWGLLASVLLIEFCRGIPRNKFLTFVGQNSIGFYFMSGALPILFSITAKKIIPDSHVWVVLPVFVGCVVVAYFVVMIFCRYLPWLFDLRQLWKKDK